MVSLLGHLGVALIAAHPHRPASSPADALAGLAQALELTDDLDLIEARTDPADEAQPPVSTTVKATAQVEHVATSQNSRSAASPDTSNTRPESAPKTADVGAAEQLSGPRFAMTVAVTVGKPSVGISAGATPSELARSRTGSADTSLAPIPAAAADVPARLRVGAAPKYTLAALSAGVEASVQLEIVVSSAGLVTSARGLERVGYGLDECALQSVLSYRFSPALRGGAPVAVRMRWLMRFQLS